MKVYELDDMIGGWFIGGFSPTVYKGDFEVCYKKHPQGEIWDSHYHKIATEINLLVRGLMKINDVIIHPGQIFVIYPEEVASPVFLEDCELVVVKTKSVPGDKYIV